MFTGLITHQGRIDAFSEGALRIRVADLPAPLGASIAVGGICLTVTASDASGFSAQLSPETLARTTAAHWSVGDTVNLEASLKLGDTLGGHLVSGHVDGVAVIRSVSEIGNAWRYELSAPSTLMPFIAVKGSVTLDGVSLTVNEVADALQERSDHEVRGERGGETPPANTFAVMIIPHTYHVTTLGQRKAGDTVNIEVDMLARYVARILEARAA